MVKKNTEVSSGNTKLKQSFLKTFIPDCRKTIIDNLTKEPLTHSSINQKIEHLIVDSYALGKYKEYLDRKSTKKTWRKYNARGSPHLFPEKGRNFMCNEKLCICVTDSKTGKKKHLDVATQINRGNRLIISDILIVLSQKGYIVYDKKTNKWGSSGK